jgi:DNA-binding transcriptional regulator YhcF (GntR family)
LAFDLGSPFTAQFDASDVLGRVSMIQQIERQFVRTSRPLYAHLVSLLEGAISRGDLPSGTKVPPERELAQRLRISRTTVVSAYRELESRGLLRGYVGRGTFVCAAPEPSGTPFAWRGKIASAALRSSDSTLRDTIRHSSDARLLSLAAGEPAIDCFPTEAFQRAIDQVLKRDARAAWRHGPTEGQPILREAIADRFGVPAESVLVLAGAQQGLDLLARCLVDPGDAVILDRPGYLGAIQSFRAAGAKLIVERSANLAAHQHAVLRPRRGRDRRQRRRRVRLVPVVHGAGHGSLWRRRRAECVRRARRARALGRVGRGAGRHHRSARDRQRRRPHAAAVPVSASGRLCRFGEHR